MAKSEPADRPKPKRARGRPVGDSDQTVGRESLIAAARRLLAVEAPSKVTTASIAREAGVDPALVRYHFGDRLHLLLAVVEDLLVSNPVGRPPAGASTAERLEKQVRVAMRLARSARSMQRLMVEELGSAKSPEIRARLSAMNGVAITNMANIINDGAEDADPIKPLFLFIALIGMVEFFVAAEPMIVPQIPSNVDFDTLTDQYTDFVSRLLVGALDHP